jgi:hypothetical protein
MLCSSAWRAFWSNPFAAQSVAFPYVLSTKCCSSILQEFKPHVNRLNVEQVELHPPRSYGRSCTMTRFFLEVCIIRIFLHWIMKLNAIARACSQTPTMQEFLPICTLRSYWIKVCNVVLLLSYFHGHAGSQALIATYAGMCTKPTEAGKRVGEQQLGKRQRDSVADEQQASQPATQPKGKQNCICM